jgi:UDP-N-acetylglucosamine--N-acetylmuramyl-(pentapeptide) pyrophosphoryl-undecaprenol N-acetylglucosamine transferase
MDAAATPLVMITTGGTGGHVFPGLAVAAKLVARGARVFWLGTRDGIESDLVPRHGVDFEAVPFRGVRGKGLATLLTGPFALAAACWRSLQVIRRRAPDVVLGLGGFASFPGALMAVASGRPLAIHDSNAVAGLANRVLAWGADRVLLGFPNAMRGRHATITEWTGNPLRDAIAAVVPPDERFAGRSGPLRLLVVGGSLGAQGLNDRVPAALAAMPPASRPRVFHQSGARHLDALVAAYRAAGVEAECVAFIDDMAARYAWADFAIARGGALTVSELAAVGLGALVVPLPGAIADEQTANAEFLVEAGAAARVAQDALTPQALASFLAGLDRPRALAMARAARALGRADAADRVAGACLALAGGRRA